MNPNCNCDDSQLKPETLSRQTLDHMRRPHNFGPPERFDGHGCITGPCGDTMNFWLQVAEDRIRRVHFTTDGCATSVACGSMCASLAEGLAIAEAKTVTQARILETLGSIPSDDAHCALLAANTLMAAVRDYLIRRPQQSWMRMYR